MSAIGLDAGSMFGTDLHPRSMPDWLRVACVHRLPHLDDRTSWHTLYRMALDVSALPILPRTAARILVDWHGNRASSVIVEVSDIAHRIPAHRVNTQNALSDLVAAGWLTRVRQAGKASILTLLIPLEPVAESYTPPVADSYNPVAESYNPCSGELHHQGKGEEGQSQGHARHDSRQRPARARPTVTIDHLNGDAGSWDGFYDPEAECG